MSVALLLADVAKKSSVQLAQVSTGLLTDLHVANELAVRPLQFAVPSDPKYKEVIDGLLRAMGYDSDAFATAGVYVLRKHPQVAVQDGALHQLRLAPSGAGSYHLS